MIENFDWSSHLKECLDSTTYCCLATSTGNSVWANPVYFSYDDALSLYFVSQPHSLHMKNIQQNDQISVAIYNTAQSTHGDVIGMQIKARASIVQDRAVAEEAYDRYYGRVHPQERKNPDKPSASYYFGSTAEWIFVKIVPLEIWYFDTRYFGEERAQVPEGVGVRGV